MKISPGIMTTFPGLFYRVSFGIVAWLGNRLVAEQSV